MLLLALTVAGPAGLQQSSLDQQTPPVRRLRLALALADKAIMNRDSDTSTRTGGYINGLGKHMRV
jgi:hypothetical protein